MCVVQDLRLFRIALLFAQCGHALVIALGLIRAPGACIDAVLAHLLARSRDRSVAVVMAIAMHACICTTQTLCVSVWVTARVHEPGQVQPRSFG